MATTTLAAHVPAALPSMGADCSFDCDAVLGSIMATPLLSLLFMQTGPSTGIFVANCSAQCSPEASARSPESYFQFRLSIYPSVAGI